MGKAIWQPGTLLAPVPPAMVTCGTLQKPNIITIAWTGILNSTPPVTYISVRPERYSHDIISQSKEFVINLTTRDLVFACDYCGVKSGAKEDKFKSTKLTPGAASEINAPILMESPVNIECRVREVLPLGTHDMFIANIMAVQIDERFIDKNGKLDMSLCGLIAYSHGEYFALGEKLGSFGYSVRKKK